MNRLFTSAARTASLSSRAIRGPATPARLAVNGVRFSSNDHSAESFADFSKRYTTFFDNAEDLFELQRGLNNCFAYDLVPGVDVIEAALKASRRLDTYSTAVRVLEGVREKVENPKQYEAYLQELKGIREELGINTKEELYGEH
ncbi:Cytochrome c oxidase subunit 6 [Tulasnella sp. 417]|nr:Cytochrome c oxidase subunit 6 [Tulasnella sp. 417]